MEEGFYELPLEMRLRDAYTSPRIISHSHLAQFFEEEFATLKNQIKQIDRALLPPL